MSCVLRATGTDFDVDAFLEKSELKPLIVHHRGQPRFAVPNTACRPEERSGMNLSVSTRAFSDLIGQIEDAIQFLSTNHDELRRLREFHGVEQMLLDFPLEDRDAMVQRDTFPARLLLLLGTLKIDLAISRYPAQEGKEIALDSSKGSR